MVDAIINVCLSSLFFLYHLKQNLINSNMDACFSAACRGLFRGLLFFIFFLTLIQLEGHRSFACIEEERIGLLKLKHAINPNGSALSSWGGEKEMDCCKWEYVTCDLVSKRVLQISLVRIRQFLSVEEDSWLYLDVSSFLPFEQLQNVSLAWNNLRGFKGEFRSSKLVFLDLQGNELTEIPQFLGELNSLKHLDLSKNNLKNLSRFEDLTALSFLETLNLAGTGTTSSMLPLLFALKNLKALYLSGNNLNDSLPEGQIRGELSSSKLEYLDLSWNSLTGIPSFFSELKSLKHLDLSSNSLANLSCFEGLTRGKPRSCKLEYLGLSATGLTGIPPFLSELKSLKHLDLSSNRLANLSCFKGFKGRELRSSKSEYLDLRRNSLTGIPPFLRELKSLKHLDLSWNGLANSSSHYKDLTTLSSLETLRLDAAFTTGSIPKPILVLTNLKALSLRRNQLNGTLPEVAYNNLSGSLPDPKAQFGTFEKSSYEGNPLLCGPPLERSCTSNRQSPSTSIPPSSGEGDSFRDAFVMSSSVTGAVAFVGTLCFFYFSAYHRDRLFELVF